MSDGTHLVQETIVLLHGAATGSRSWSPVSAALTASGAKVVAPDMLGYGSSPPPSSVYGIREEVAHLTGLLDRSDVGTFHLVTHSIGALFGLHLRHSLGARVTRLTLIDPIIVSVLREAGEYAAFAEMEDQYQRFVGLSADPEAAAHFFVHHWSGAGAWDQMSERARAMVTSLVPRLRLEMIVTRSDTATLAWFAAAPPPTTLLIGENTLIAPRAVARVLAPAFRATSVMISGAAHMIPMTHPEVVVAAVLAGSELGGISVEDKT